jgi:hypothetical protein
MQILWEMEQPDRETALRELCRRLMPEDPSLEDEVHLALTDPVTFANRFAERLADRGIADPDELDPWVSAFVDGLIERRRATAVDWKSEPDKVTAAIDEGLSQLAQRPDRWAWLSQDQPLNTGAAEILEVIAHHLAEEDVTLACVDTGSDEYCLTVLEPAAANEIRALSLRAAPPGIRGILLPPSAHW